MEAGSWEREAGSGKREVGRWKLEDRSSGFLLGLSNDGARKNLTGIIRSGKMGAGSGKSEAGSGKWEDGSRKREVGSWELGAGSGKKFPS